MEKFFGPGHGIEVLVMTPFFIALMVWSLYWKGLALWHAGQYGQPWWFVAMLIINTAGILEIVYLFVILKLKFKDLFTSKVTEEQRSSVLPE